MTGSPMDQEPDGTGGLPVGRLAADRAGAGGGPTRPSQRRMISSALPLIILALVAGLGIGLTIGLLVNRGSAQGAATTSSPAATTLPPDGTSATSTTSGGTETTVDTTGAYGVVTVSGAALPVLQQGVQDTALGLAVPAISGVDFDGNAQVITADGTAKLIVALAHWCPYCNQELPVLRDWYNGADLPAEVEVILLSVFANPARDNFPPSTWLAQFSWSGPVLADDAQGSLATALGIASVPHNLLVSPDGTVAARVTGGLTAEQLDSAVEFLAGLSGTTTTTP
jgi:hypothetical protein